HADELAAGLERAGAGQGVLVEEDQRQAVGRAPAQQDLGRARGLADRPDRAEHDDLAADPALKAVDRVPVGEDDPVAATLGLALEGLDEVGPAVPPLEADVVVGVVLLAGVPDPALGGSGLVLGRDELGVEAARVAVLAEVGAHAGAHALDVVVVGLAVLLDEHVGEVAVVEVADLLGMIAL